MMKFKSTKDSPGENRKARLKNKNILILAKMYHGNDDGRLRCLITGAPAFTTYRCHIRETDIDAFEIDFNHIRQQMHPKHYCTGISVDKDRYAPSILFREVIHYDDLVEFGCMMPVSQNYHKVITSGACYKHVILNTFPKETWPWHLQSKENFNSFWGQYNIAGLTYHRLLRHLNDITAPPIRERLEWTHDGLVFT